MITATQVPDGRKVHQPVRQRRDALWMRPSRALKAVRRLVADKEDAAQVFEIMRVSLDRPRRRRRHTRTVAAPHASIATPQARAIHGPPGSTFSAMTSRVRAAIQARFITPPTNSSAMSIQQQPTQ